MNNKSTFIFLITQEIPKVLEALPGAGTKNKYPQSLILNINSN